MLAKTYHVVPSITVIINPNTINTQHSWGSGIDAQSSVHSEAYSKGPKTSGVLVLVCWCSAGVADVLGILSDEIVAGDTKVTRIQEDKGVEGAGDTRKR